MPEALSYPTNLAVSQVRDFQQIMGEAVLALARRIASDHIPEMQALAAALQQRQNLLNQGYISS